MQKLKNYWLVHNSYPFLPVHVYLAFTIKEAVKLAQEHYAFRLKSNRYVIWTQNKLKKHLTDLRS